MSSARDAGSSIRAADQEGIPIPPPLSPYVLRILVQDGGGGAAHPAPEQTYRVLPGPFPVLGFQARGRLRVLRPDDGSTLLDRSGVTGLVTTARDFRAEANTHTVLVVLRPCAGFALFGGLPMHELSEAHVGLDRVLDSSSGDPAAALSRLADRLAEADARGNSLTDPVTEFLLGRIGGITAERRQPHPAVRAAVRRLLRAHGSVPIGEAASELSVSARQLERLFLREVGVGPKRFASLIRFHWAARQIRAAAAAAPSPDWSTLARDAGYADQAHFIRDFALHAGGVTPARFAADLVIEARRSG